MWKASVLHLINKRAVLRLVDVFGANFWLAYKLTRLIEIHFARLRMLNVCLFEQEGVI